MKSSRRELSINTVIDWFIFKNNPLSRFFYLFNLHTQNRDPTLKTRIIFYCVWTSYISTNFRRIK